MERRWAIREIKATCFLKKEEIPRPVFPLFIFGITLAANTRKKITQNELPLIWKI
jgi:hypothetical protein